MATNDIKCPKCKATLEWVDTFRTYGGIQDDYYMEASAWECPQCKKEYIATHELDTSTAKLIKLEEN